MIVLQAINYWQVFIPPTVLDFSFLSVHSSAHVLSCWRCDQGRPSVGLCWFFDKNIQRCMIFYPWSRQQRTPLMSVITEWAAGLGRQTGVHTFWSISDLHFNGHLAIKEYQVWFPPHTLHFLQPVIQRWEKCFANLVNTASEVLGLLKR